MNEIEEKFYKTFGIEPYTFAVWDSKETQIKDFESMYEYPEITDRILLELEDILLKHHIQVEYCYLQDNYYCSCTISLCNGKANNKRDAFLQMLICIAENYLDNSDQDGEEEIYHQVQSLFTEGEE